MLVLFVFLLLAYSPVSGSPLPLSESRAEYAGQALSALQRLLDFFERDAEQVNLDGIFCLRIAQGQLNALCDAINASTSLTDHSNIIQSLSVQIDRIANKTLSGLAQTPSLYLEKFILLPSQVFLVEYKSRQLNNTLIESEPGKEHNNDWDLSNRCFSELLGSYDDPSNSTPCLVSDVCWKMVTSRMTTDYRLTHQLLWILIARNQGCVQTPLFSNETEKNHDYLENFFCANIYEDAKSNLEKHLNQDLFLEQLLLCSVLGFEEFLRLDWLGTILTWQHPEYACFTLTTEIIPYSRRAKRHLLTEQEMDHGCLSHKSGLAAGLLATYTRFFLQ